MSRRKTTSRSNSKLEIEKAPLIITIVPQCSQKSTILKELTDDDIDEISVDDVPQSFEKVPIGVALSQMDYADSAFITSEIAEASAAYSDRNTYGISVFSRIADLKDTEQGLLLQLFTNSITFDTAEAALRASVAEADIEALLGAVKDMLAQKSVMTSSTVDIYIPQANTYSVQTAKTTLRDAAKNSDNVIVWSNINSSIDHYSDALAIAMQNKRPVRFIRWGLEVPPVSFEQLVADNISTFLSTGRYATVANIRSSLDKVLSLIDIDNDYTHERLAYIAGYSMDNNGLLKKVNPLVAYVKGPETAVYDGKLKAWFQNPQAQANMAARKVVVKEEKEVEEEVEAVSPVSEESESAPLNTSQSHSSSDIAVPATVVGGVTGDSDSDSGVKNPIVLTTTTPPSSVTVTTIGTDSAAVNTVTPTVTDVHVGADAGQVGTPLKVEEAKKGVAVVTPTSLSPPSVVSVPSVSPDRLNITDDVAAKMSTVNDAHVEPCVTDMIKEESNAHGDEKKEADVGEEGVSHPSNPVDSVEVDTKKSSQDVPKSDVKIGDTIIADQNSKRHCCFSFFGFNF